MPAHLAAGVSESAGGAVSAGGAGVAAAAAAFAVGEVLVGRPSLRRFATGRRGTGNAAHTVATAAPASAHRSTVSESTEALPPLLAAAAAATVAAAAAAPPGPTSLPAPCSATRGGDAGRGGGGGGGGAAASACKGPGSDGISSRAVAAVGRGAPS